MPLAAEFEFKLYAEKHELGSYDIAVSSYSDYDAKKQRWDDMAREVDSWTDGLGMGIDEKIKDTVIVLNLLGFKTRQSCEGHLSWGHSYPWISLELDDTEYESLKNQWIAVAEKVDEAEKAAVARHPELEVAEALLLEEEKAKLIKLWKARNDACNKAEQYRKMKLAPLQELLMIFYRDGANPDTMITHEYIDNIASIGGYWQDIRDDATKAVKLKEYQDEMRRFTDFLIEKYYAALIKV